MCNQPVEWRAPRQPAGVGVSTISTDSARGMTDRCTPAARRGGSLNAFGVRRFYRCTIRCTPAARRGGSLNGVGEGDDADITDVHPGSPPGWESQPFSHLVCVHVVLCTPAARRGGSLNFTRAGGTLMTGTCTPAARRGGSLNIQMTCSMSAAFAVHPGSPPGWESQLRVRGWGWGES